MQEELSLSTDYEASRAALNQSNESSCFLLLQLDKTVQTTLQVVASGMDVGSLTSLLNDSEFSFVLYKMPNHKNPFLLFYRGRNVPAHIKSAVLVNFSAIVRMLEPFDYSFVEVLDPEDLSDDIIEKGVKRGGILDY